MKRTTNPARNGFISFNDDEMSLYLRKINSIPSLTSEEEKEVALRAKNGDKTAKKELVQSNLKLVLTIARKAIHVSKIPMTFEVDKGRIFTNVSLDQKNPGQGYTKDNIQLVCSAVNQLKSNWDMDTVLYICKQVINNYES